MMVVAQFLEAQLAPTPQRLVVQDGISLVTTAVAK
jgi:hypothetical protein